MLGFLKRLGQLLQLHLLVAGGVSTVTCLCTLCTRHRIQLDLPGVVVGYRKHMCTRGMVSTFVWLRTVCCILRMLC